MEGLLLLPIALAGAGLYLLFSAPSRSGMPEFPEEANAFSAPIMESEEAPSVLSVHAAPQLAKPTAGE